MIIKTIQLRKHALNVAYVEPIKRSKEDVLLLFLHEALGSIPQWRNFPQLLCDEMNMRGIIYERQGHGLSDPLTDERDENYLHNYAYEELSNLLEIILPADKKVILVGHSDGGTIALLYAAKFPKQVAGIVTMAAHVLAEPETLAGIHPAVEAYKLGKLDGLKNFHGEKTEELFFAWANTWLNPFFKNWNIEGDIRDVNCPALIIQGKDDQYGTALQVQLIVDNLIDAEGLLLDNCQHHPHLERIEEVCVVINKWYKNKFH